MSSTLSVTFALAALGTVAGVLTWRGLVHGVTFNPLNRRHVRRDDSPASFWFCYAWISWTGALAYVISARDILGLPDPLPTATLVWTSAVAAAGSLVSWKWARTRTGPGLVSFAHGAAWQSILRELGDDAAAEPNARTLAALLSCDEPFVQSVAGHLAAQQMPRSLDDAIAAARADARPEHGSDPR